jgi:hypothetical protein
MLQRVLRVRDLLPFVFVALDGEVAHLIALLEDLETIQGKHDEALDQRRYFLDEERVDLAFFFFLWRTLLGGTSRLKDDNILCWSCNRRADDHGPLVPIVDQYG